MRVRVTLDISKPMKRRMKLKMEGGNWSQVNFKYERLTIFCFVCGILGHSDRDCEVVYANPGKTIDRAYGVWLRAPNKNVKNQNLGAKWLRNSSNGGQSWSSGSQENHGNGMQEGRDVTVRFMETDGIMTEIPGKEVGMQFKQRDQGDYVSQRTSGLSDTVVRGGNIVQNEIVVLDSKRRRLDIDNELDTKNQERNMVVMESDNTNGPKNGLEEGTGLQARLQP